jgi:hypothetical protein
MNPDRYRLEGLAIIDGHTGRMIATVPDEQRARLVLDSLNRAWDMDADDPYVDHESGATFY